MQLTDPGTLNDINLWQLLMSNVESNSSSIFESNVNEEMPEFENASSPIRESEEGSLNDVRLEQLPNERVPILVTVFGISQFDNKLHPSKQYSLMV